MTVKNKELSSELTQVLCGFVSNQCNIRLIIHDYYLNRDIEVIHDKKLYQPTPEKTKLTLCSTAVFLQR